jgi:hypothetical protein
MFANTRWCLAASVCLLAAAPLEPDRAGSAAPAANCCAASERRLAKQPLPAEAREAQLIRDVYRFVGSHLELMTQVPCFCGCDRLGHTSVADCFVEHPRDGARATWSAHGAG